MAHQTLTDEDIDLALDDEPQPPATPGPTRTGPAGVALDARDLLHAVAYLAAVGLAGGAGIALATVTR